MKNTPKLMDGENWSLFNRRFLVEVLKTCQIQFSAAFQHIQPACFHTKHTVTLEALPPQQTSVKGHRVKGGGNLTQTYMSGSTHP